MEQETETAATSETSLDLAKTVETLAKALALCAAIVYGCGFLVITIGQAGHSYSQLNPFHPKAVAAGMWLLLFVGAPVFLYEQSYRFKEWLAEEIEKAAQSIPAGLVEDGTLPVGSQDINELTEAIRDHGKKEFHHYLTFGPRLFLFAAGCQGLGSLIFDEFVDHPLTASSPSWSWMDTAIGVVLLANVVSVVGSLRRRLSSFLSALIAVMYVGLLLVKGFESDPLTNRLSESNVILWFLGMGLIAALRRRFVPLPLRIESTYLFLCMAAPVLIVLTFAGAYYPQLDPGWGGGSPRPVVIYFKSDPARLLGKSVNAYLLEESDQGFYIAQDAEVFSRAAFVPRSEVTVVDFEESTASQIERGKTDDLEGLRLRLSQLPNFPMKASPEATLASREGRGDTTATPPDRGSGAQSAAPNQTR